MNILDMMIFISYVKSLCLFIYALIAISLYYWSIFEL